MIFSFLQLIVILSGTPPECQDCKEEVNCSGGKGVQASSGEGTGGAGAGAGGEGGGGGEDGGGSELCAYECKARGGCTVRYTGPPRGGPSIGDFISITISITRNTIIKVPASLLRLEVLAVELRLSVETATKPGPH